MACQPAIQARQKRPLFQPSRISHLPVACYAKAHLELDRLKPVLRLHVSVTVAAIKLLPEYMRLMPEKNKIWRVKNSFPRNRGVCLQVLLFNLDLRMIRNDVFMAIETLLDRWKPRVLRTLDIGMAEPAVDLLHPRMYAMAEVNWLNGPDHLFGINIAEEKHERERKPSSRYPDTPALHFSTPAISLRLQFCFPFFLESGKERI